MTVTKASWGANILYRRNREGIPDQNGVFREIFDLDYICEQQGGEKIGGIRLPFGPYTTGQFEDHAETLYKVGDLLVHNVVRGWHPNWMTRVLAEGKLPERKIVRRFETYYRIHPNISVDEQLNLEQAEASILDEMRKHQNKYDTRDSPMRLAARIVELAPPEMSLPIIEALTEDLRASSVYKK